MLMVIKLLIPRWQ